MKSYKKSTHASHSCRLYVDADYKQGHSENCFASNVSFPFSRQGVRDPFHKIQFLWKLTLDLPKSKLLHWYHRFFPIGRTIMPENV